MNNIVRTAGQAIGTTLVSVLLAAELVPGTELSNESGYTALLLSRKRSISSNPRRHHVQAGEQSTHGLR